MEAGEAVETSSYLCRVCADPCRFLDRVRNPRFGHDLRNARRLLPKRGRRPAVISHLPKMRRKRSCSGPALWALVRASMILDFTCTTEAGGTQTVDDRKLIDQQGLLRFRPMHFPCGVSMPL